MVDGGKSASFSSLRLGERLNGLTGSESVCPLLSRSKHSWSSLQRSKSLLLLLPFDNDEAVFDDASECVGFDDVESGVFVEVAADVIVEVASDVLEGAGERFPFEDAAAEWEPPFRTLKFELNR